MLKSLVPQLQPDGANPAEIPWAKTPPRANRGTAGWPSKPTPEAVPAWQPQPPQTGTVLPSPRTSGGQFELLLLLLLDDQPPEDGPLEPWLGELLESNSPDDVKLETAMADALVQVGEVGVGRGPAAPKALESGSRRPRPATLANPLD